jgi:hypothetical protein
MLASGRLKFACALGTKAFGVKQETRKAGTMQGTGIWKAGGREQGIRAYVFLAYRFPASTCGGIQQALGGGKRKAYLVRDA